ncbi:hypothetical protein D9619_004777 [Psilocybe cf. subviscida]|uniref:Uncharacterized protein n=1 Tax=Psilocybe cf. subviscida TaxID=2480587 RepID=A0A8H5BRE9_9AGAR|nr:hypothetical protein D9619_004777 [Psilocybe cf. subviscida]
MPPLFSLVHIIVHNAEIRGNPQLNYGDGGQTTQANDDPHNQLYPPHCTQANEWHMMGQLTERRVEAQRKIRRKLGEVSSMGPETILGLDVVALRAIAIMSVVDNNAIRSAPLVELAMSAHATLNEETRPRCILARWGRLLGQNRRRRRILRMHEDLRDILQEIEGNNDAEILSSLELALECPYQ